MRNILLASIATFAIAGPASAQSSADEIRAALVGNTFQGDMGSSEYTGFFGADGTYVDASGTGPYTITDEGVCYPGTDFGCYQATIEGDQLRWMQNGEAMGSGTILEGNPLGLGKNGAA